MTITKEQIIEQVFKKYLDPELHIDVWALGLIYDFTVKEQDGKINVWVKMTFTSPMCPLGPQMIDELETMIKEQGADDVTIEITFEPAWKPSEELREMLGV